MLKSNKTLSRFICFFLSLTAIAIHAQFNTLDPSFNPNDPGFGKGDGLSQTSGGARVYAFARQTDGKIIVVGTFNSYNSVTMFKNIMRINPDGSLDNSFHPSSGFISGTPKCVLLQSDGKILVGGGNFNYNGVSRSGLVRINADGSVDVGFNPTFNSEVLGLKQMPSGKIIAVGSFTTVNSAGRTRIAILNSDGSLDSGFNPGSGFEGLTGFVSTRTIAIQADSKIIIGGRFTKYNGSAAFSIARIDSIGTIDASFNAGTGIVATDNGGAEGEVNAMILQNDQKILVAGNFNRVNGNIINGLTRLNSNGSFDASFIQNKTCSPIYSICQQSDGKIIVGSGSNMSGLVVFSYKQPGSAGGVGKYSCMARFNLDGSMDFSFGPYGLVGANVDIHATLITENDKFIVGGDFTSINLVSRSHIAGMLADGNVDTNFDLASGSNSTILDIIKQPDGNFLLGGYLTMYNGKIKKGICRIKPDGSLDNSFDAGRGPITDAQNIAEVESISMQSDGKILVGGSFTQFNEANTESSNYIGSNSPYITRLKTDGSPDNSFNNPCTPPPFAIGDVVYKIIILPGDKILMAGRFKINGVNYGLLRLNSDGTIDPSFKKGIADDYIFTMCIDASNRILLGGNFTKYNNISSIRIVRLDSLGNIDPGFVTSTGANNKIRKINVQSDGTILIAGDFTQYKSINAKYLARILENGDLDMSFGSNPGPGSIVTDIMTLPDNKIMITGDFSIYNNIIRNRIARLNANGSLDPNFTYCGGLNSSGSVLALGDNYKLLIGGGFTSINDCGKNRIGKIYLDSISGNKISNAQTICYNSVPDFLQTDLSAGGLDCHVYSFQWQSSSDGITFGNIVNAINETLQPERLTSNTWYRRKATINCGSTFSNSIKINVLSPVTGNTIKSDQSICYNTMPNDIVTNIPATGGDGIFSYQWQSSTNGIDFTDMINSNSENLLAGNQINTTWFRRIARNKCGDLISNSIKITVYPPLTGNHVATDQTICYNSAPSTLTTTIAPSGGNGIFNYQWQVSQNGNNYSDIPNANQENLSPGNLIQPTYFQRLAISSSGCGTLTSNPVLINAVDDENPIIIAPDEIVVAADEGQCYATGYNLGQPQISDNCTVDHVMNDDQGSYSVGTHYITWTVYDQKGNYSTATQAITVLDHQNPEIIAPESITVNTDEGLCSASGYLLGTPQTSDNCGIALISNDDQGTYTTGTHNIIWTVTDINNNQSTATQTITVIDNQPPFITPPSDLEVNADEGSCYATGYDLGLPETSDNCAVQSVTNDDAGLNSVGIHTIIWTVTDVNGNTSTAEQKLNVLDNQLPVIIAPNQIVVNANEGSCFASEYILGSPQTSDNCGVAFVSNDDKGLYSVGSHTIVWQVTDGNGNTSTAEQTITVIDNQNPFLNPPPDVTVNSDEGTCIATNYQLGSPVTADNCEVSTIGNDDQGSYEVGAHTITWSVYDINGNSTTATQTLIVIDREIPVIFAPASISIAADQHYCETRNYDLGTPVTSDNCGVYSITNDDAGSYTVGSHQIHWFVTDIHGNSASASQTITVFDNQKPILSVPADITVNTNPGLCEASNYLLGTPTCTDNCAVGTISNNDNGNHTPGTYQINWTVYDVNGNSNTAAQSLTVKDAEPPVARCKDITLSLNNSGEASLDPQLLDNGSSDNCGINNLNASKTIFHSNDIGNNTVLLIATDVDGNSSSCNSNVFIHGGSTITCSITVIPSNKTYTGGIPNNIYLGYGPQTDTLNCFAVGGNGFSFNWSPATFLSCSNCRNPVFSPTSPGIYNYTVIVQNNKGGTSSCNVSLCVRDIKDKQYPGKYLVCHNGHTISIDNSAIPAHIPGHPGDKLGDCSDVCQATNSNSLISIKDEPLNHEDWSQAYSPGVIIYPNPSFNEFIIEWAAPYTMTQIEVFDIFGRLLESKEWKETLKHGYFGEELFPGTYFVKIRQGQESQMIKIVKSN